MYTIFLCYVSHLYISDALLLITHPTTSTTQLAARLTLLHVDYHTRMGFAGTLLYVHNTMADSMGTHPALQQLVAQGRLGLVQWRYMAQYVEMGTYDQVVVHNHALLALWARNAWAFITGMGVCGCGCGGWGGVGYKATFDLRTPHVYIRNYLVLHTSPTRTRPSSSRIPDLDELLATPHPTNVHALLGPGGCMSGHQTITLPQYDTLCQSCVGVDQRSTEFDHGVDHDVLHGEAGMWLGNATGLKPLKEYTLRNTSPLQVCYVEGVVGWGVGVVMSMCGPCLVLTIALHHKKKNTIT